MVSRKVTVDTSIIIDHLRQIKQSKTLLRTILKDKHTAFIISSDVIQELFAGQSSKTVEPKDEIRKILQSFHIIDVTPEIAELAGQIMRDSKLSIQFADAAIAATAITNNALLATLNKKDFQGIPDLEFV
ncbi:MAG: PIN domain-containing protein [Candidatus Daviesbacteria bacterium]|nr:PIN domain-containing protein [Candidatus Daviesbacteria bacterium]